MTGFGQQPSGGGGFGSPFGDPFGAGGQGLGHQGGHPDAGLAAPPPVGQQLPPRANSGGALWPILSAVVGMVGVALVLVPFYSGAPFWLGLIGAAIGLAGLAAGIIGMRQAHRDREEVPALAISGLVAAGVAIVLAVSSVLVQVNSHAGSSPAPSTAAAGGDATSKILRDELEVTFGAFEYTLDGSGDRVRTTRMPVTFHNKLNDARNFSVDIAAFADEHTQIGGKFFGKGGSPGTLEANATTTVDYFTFETDPAVAEKLKSAEFKVVTARGWKV
ncbi:hypothetical protein [Mycobacterium sp. NPDC050441]|uniref:hypothetical protein n=1 Tax=Mycobacterium sp. NPDC050441 TaxID=3155403 RepID=UPI00340B9200